MTDEINALLKEHVKNQKQIVHELKGIRGIISSLCGLIDDLTVKISK